MRGPGLIRTLPVGAGAVPGTLPKNLLCGVEGEVDEELEPRATEEDPREDSDVAGCLPPQADGPMEDDEPAATTTGDASPAPQATPRDKKDWKALLEPLLYKLLLRIKKALRRIQQLHCPMCLRYETQETSLEDICTHLKVPSSFLIQF